MSSKVLLLVFRLGEQRYALPLAVVERVVRAVAVTPLPGAPDIVLGAIDVQGWVIPVLSIRQRLGQEERDLDPGDQFVLARTAGRRVALVIDEAQEVIVQPEAEIIDADQIVPGGGPIKGVVKLEDGLLLVHDLESVLSLDEAAALNQALDGEPTHGTTHGS